MPKAAQHVHCKNFNLLSLSLEFGLITQYVILILKKKRNARSYLLKAVLTSGEGRRSSKGNGLVDLVEGAGKKTDVDTTIGQIGHLFA